MISFTTIWNNLMLREQRIAQLEQEVQELRDAVQSFALPAPPEFRGKQVSRATLGATIALATNIDPFVLDSVGRVVDHRDFLRFTRDERASRELYVAEAFDCDDFALTFMVDCLKWGSNCALVVGTMTANGVETPHAWVGAVTDTGGGLSFVQVEPQTGLVGPDYKPLWVMVGG